MLAHIRLSRLRFTFTLASAIRPLHPVQRLAWARILGSRQVPRAPSPRIYRGWLAPPGEALPSLHRYYGLMRQSQILRLPLLSLVEPVFAGSCQSLLEVGPSRYYLCNHSMVACAHTPGKVRGALVHFFPRTDSLSIGDPGSTFPTVPRRNFYGEGDFRGGSNSLIFRLPSLLGPLVAPTLYGAAGPFSPRPSWSVASPSCGIATHPPMDN